MREQRFQVSFEEEQTDQPGLVLGQDGVVSVVEAGGTRRELNAIRLATVALDNEQIKALPTAAVEIVAAPAADEVLCPIYCVVAKDFRGGAYTNVGSDGTSRLSVSFGNGQGPQAGAAFVVAGIQFPSTGYFDADTLEQEFLTCGAFDAGLGEVFPPGYNDFSGIALNLLAKNNDPGPTPLGDLVGGDDANTMKVLVAYALLDVT